MIHKKIGLLLLLVFVVLDSHAQVEEKTQEKNLKELTFGIRGDKTIADYNKVATNVTPYDTNDYPDFASVMCLVYSDDGSTFRDKHATAVLISPYWLLTAGHNFYDANTDTRPAPPEGITVQIGNDAQRPEKVYMVEKVVLHPTWLDGQQGDFGDNDICLLKLKEPVMDVTPAEILKKGKEPLGSTVWLSGFGDYNRKGNNFRPLRPKKHAIENLLDRKTDHILKSKDSTVYTTGILATDFDHPNGKWNGLDFENMYVDYKEVFGEGSSDPLPTDFEGTSVPGDSGGPLFISHKGKWKVAGILSATYATDFEESLFDEKLHFSYGAITCYSRVSSHSKWILSTIAE